MSVVFFTAKLKGFGHIYRMVTEHVQEQCIMLQFQMAPRTQKRKAAVDLETGPSAARSTKKEKGVFVYSGGHVYYFLLRPCCSTLAEKAHSSHVYLS